MKTKFNLLLFILFILIFTACGGEAPQPQQVKKTPVSISPSRDADLPSLLRSLDELAELERAGAWFQGLGVTESTIRENAGDYAGSVAAAFKELAWAYSMGLIKKEDMEQGLLSALFIQGDKSIPAAASAILSFTRMQWDDAAAGLEPLFNELDEPDGFGRWMILVCALEKSKSDSAMEDRRTADNRRAAEDRRTGAAYKSIRARYSQFPEYWYRGARVFSGNIAAQYAENCINLSPQGPYADECRSILASHTGLKLEDGLSIKTKKEIEAIISLSVNSSNPQILDPLLPLIGLPDNPYTVFAVSALKTLTGIQKFNDYFNGHAITSKGRLAERLSYICRS
jgi:hypothetical protein